MAKRNELRSLLGGLNPGNACGREHIALGDLISCDQIERLPLEPNFPACNGSSFTERLRLNINHLRATIGTDVSQPFHLRHSPSVRSAADCNHFAIGLVIVSKIVFPRLSVDHIEKKLLELFVARARP